MQFIISMFFNACLVLRMLHFRNIITYIWLYENKVNKYHLSLGRKPRKITSCQETQGI